MTRRGEGGFTLIELILTCVVLTTTILAIFGLLSTLRIINARADNLTVAVEAAQLQLENYRNLPYSAIAVGTQNTTSQLASFTKLGSTRSSSVTVSLSDARGLKRVDVVVNYADRGATKKVNLSTLVALNGIDR